MRGPNQTHNLPSAYQNAGSMTCAIRPASMAHQWRSHTCADDEMRLRKKHGAFSCAIALFPTAH
jgi:hypothetical protein